MSRKNWGLIALASLAFSCAGFAARSDTFAIGFEKPNVAKTTLKLTYGGVETFNEQQPTPSDTFTTNFRTGGSITGTYAGVEIERADQFGGAGDKGFYAAAAAGGNNNYSLTLSTTNDLGINYFGAYMTAIDRANVVQFYEGAKEVASFQLSALLPPSIAHNPAYAPPYLGFFYEPWVFINFTDETADFDRVVISEDPSYNYPGVFESDNQTVGYIPEPRGVLPITHVPPKTLALAMFSAETAVPEAPVWAMMLLGVAGLGATMRKRRRLSAVA